jgi:uncharacterized repeat protein (TIGR03847 family)
MASTMTFFREFDEVDDFSASVIGEPGSRVFFLNARVGSERVTVRCEKQQVKAISMYLRHVLSDLPPPDDRPMIPTGEARGTAVDPVFVLGPIGLGYDRRHDRLLVQLEELLDDDLNDDSSGDDETGGDGEEGGDPAEAEPPDRGHIRFYVTRDQADAFCAHADEIVAAGRATCSWCGNPIDPDGHACPRMN